MYQTKSLAVNQLRGRETGTGVGWNRLRKTPKTESFSGRLSRPNRKIGQPITFFYPDYNRRLRNYTGSCSICSKSFNHLSTKVATTTSSWAVPPIGNSLAHCSAGVTLPRRSLFGCLCPNYNAIPLHRKTECSGMLRFLCGDDALDRAN